MEVDLESDLRTWGNSLGLVIPSKLARLHGLKAGQHVRLRIEFEPAANDPEALPTWDWGGDYDIDKILDEELDR